MVFGNLQSFSSVSKVNNFRAGVCINPHFQKRHKGGEDAACLNSNLLAVADGVGGWAESGVDPAVYSKKLCKLIDELYATKDDRFMASPRELLVEACKQNKEIGSCTACLVSLDEKASVLTTANLGDSGYMILRQVPGKQKLDIFYESKE